MLSYSDIEKTLGFSGQLPVTKDWTAAPDFLKVISEYCLKEKPETIVECSSGTSSLVLSRCCQINGSGHVYSLENGETFAEKTQQQLHDSSLSDYCDVIYAPLKNVSVGDDHFQWYDINDLSVSKIDLLVIDGPPGFLQKHSRFPALPMLYEQLSSRCVIYLDDAAREDEQELVACWLDAYPEFSFEYVSNDRGCYRLER